MTVPVYIGVDIGGTSIRAARFIGESHIPDAKTKIPTLATQGAPMVIQRIEQAIREVAPPDIDQVAGIGMITPGPVDPFTGTVLFAPNISGWENLPLQRLMEERVQRPVFLGNDANLAALAEWKFGAGRGHDNLLYLTISTGIGSGMICGGKMLLGAQGLAAEAGHILAVPDGPVCGCGQRGHLEAVASGTAIGRTARRRLKAGWAPESQIRELCDGDLGRVTSATVGQAALAGDTFAQELVAEAGTFIGRSLASLLHLFNPSIVICGGGVSMLGDVLLEPMRSALYRHALNEHYWRECRIVIAELGDDAGLIGAGALAMESGRGQGSGRE